MMVPSSSGLWRRTVKEWIVLRRPRTLPHSLGRPVYMGPSRADADSITEWWRGHHGVDLEEQVYPVSAED